MGIESTSQIAMAYGGHLNSQQTAKKYANTKMITAVHMREAVVSLGMFAHFVYTRVSHMLIQRLVATLKLEVGIATILNRTYRPLE